jgi:polysaccharide biosynthesis/export protein
LAAKARLYDTQRGGRPQTLREELNMRRIDRQGLAPTSPLALLAIAAVLSGAGRLAGQTAPTVSTGSGTGQFEAAVAPKSVILDGFGPSADYLITPDDELEISVLDVPDLSKSYRVSPGGDLFISVLRDPVHAVGLTPRQLSDEIANRLKEAGMVNDPRVTVQVLQSRLHSVAIVGAVKHPQIYPLFGRTTVLDAISQAEGLDVDAGNTAVIDRGDFALRALESRPDRPASGGESTTVKVDLVKLLEDGDTAQNFALYPGDRLTVQRAGIVYVVGSVTKAGGFVLRDDRQQMTVLKALALAENLSSTAEPKRAVIIRRTAGGVSDSLEVPVPLDQILKGKAKDEPLLANDILFVPDSAAKRALHRAGEAAAQAAALTVYRIP